ncbi:DedA family protein [Jannaschia pohangensis]|uniref:Membrane protein DedA, SNARE-associated domain n=1 Tax=Jannaschia pohangensis TaxID=390807 RepID=A0A1I3TSG8_9RHOB|nr:DedA family protein [Jannaschia pohangensis]SFJ73552.1 membrane protein DedA, SNARE-associated domain [Jannaschia pohangensis]
MFEWITETMAAGGYLGLAFLMLIENVFPPIPSEIVMSLAGFLAAEGRFTLPMVIVVGTFGSVLGATFWYYVGLWLGLERLRDLAERYGRWLTISAADVDRTAEWFGRKGHWAVLIGRFLPGFRTLISVPAGVARMPIGKFLLFSTLGTVVWIGGLAIAGFIVRSQFEEVASWFEPLGWATLGAVVGIYVWRLFRMPRR